MLLAAPGYKPQTSETVAAGSLILDPADCMTSLPSGATSAIVPNSLQSLLPYGIQASSPSKKVRKKDG